MQNKKGKQRRKKIEHNHSKYCLKYLGGTHVHDFSFCVPQNATKEQLEPHPILVP